MLPFFPSCSSWLYLCMLSRATSPFSNPPSLPWIWITKINIHYSLPLVFFFFFFNSLLSSSIVFFKIFSPLVFPSSEFGGRREQKVLVESEWRSPCCYVRRPADLLDDWRPGRSPFCLRGVLGSCLLYVSIKTQPHCSLWPGLPIWLWLSSV